MSTNNMFSRLATMAGIFLLFFVALTQHSLAVGTMAGTVISNTANVQYNAGANVRTGSSTVNLTVGYKVVINLGPSSSSTITADSTILYKGFYVNNLGNYPDNFKVSVGHVPTGWSAALYRDLNNDGVWQGTDSSFASGTAFYTDTLIANRIYFIAKITIPRGANAGDNMADSVTVHVESNGTGPSGVTRVGGAGQKAYFANVTIAKPVITLSGSQTTTPTNAIPGAQYVYTLTLQNTGHAAIQNGATLMFKLDDDFLYQSSSNSGANSGTLGNGNGGTVRWTLNNTDLPASMAGTITRTVTVIIENTTNTGTGARMGNAITIMDSTAGYPTTTDIVYNDGLHGWTVGTPALSSITVAKASGMSIALWNSTAIRSGNPGDTLRRIIAIKNTGNATASVPNGFSFTRTQTAYTPTVSIHQRYDTATTRYGTYTVRTDTTGATFSFYLAGGDSAYVMVSDSIFANMSSVDGASITYSYTVQTTDASPITPLVGGATTQTLAGNQTIVTAPNISIVLTNAILSPSVGTTTNPAPGDSLEFTITVSNTGTGTATSVTVSNAIPANTTFIANGYGTGMGILVDGTPNLNTGGAPGFASCNGTTLNAGAYSIAGGSPNKVIKYKVRVN